MRAYAARKKSRSANKSAALEARQNELARGNLEVPSDAVVGRSIGELRIRDPVGVVVSRLGSPREGMVPTKYTMLKRGDVVTAVGSKDALARARTFFGATSALRLDAQREHVDLRRILLSRRALVGKTLDALDLEQRFNAQVTRVRRADLDLLPSPETRLQLEIVSGRGARRADAVSNEFSATQSVRSGHRLLALALGIGR